MRNQRHRHVIGRWTGSVRYGATAALLIAGLSCSDNNITGIAGPPAAMLIVSGDLQTAAVGTELPAPVVVKVTDAAGIPVKNQIVNFRVVAGGGSVFAGAALTNDAGEARERWTLGTVAGADQRLEARAVDPDTGDPLVFAVFRATAAPGAASQMVLTTNAAGAASGAAFTTQPVVTIRDAAGNTVTTDNSTVVTMTVNGNGSVVGTAAATASAGVATFSTVGIRGTAGTTYTLSFAATGPAAVTQSISLTAGATASLTLSPPSASLFVSDHQLDAVAKDADGNVVADAVVTWASLNEAVATVSTSGRVTPVAEGAALIIGTSSGKADTTTITVLPFTFTTLAAAGDHTCGLSSSGAAFCWGRNDAGQLGDGTTTHRMTPVAVQGGLIFTALTARLQRSCGLTSAGAGYCWGDNESGNLGDGTTTDRLTPVAVQGGLTFIALTTAGGHSCGLTSAGAAFCWGFNHYGQLGDGTTTFRSAPVAVQGGHTFAAITTGNEHTCGLTSAGEAYCWGYARSGALGDGSGASEFELQRSLPSQVQGGAGFTLLRPGGYHTCGLKGTTPYCWGESGKLGDGTTTTRYAPVVVQGGHAFSVLTAGHRHNCAATSSGEGYCWGDNDEGGRLGDGSTTDRLTPVLIQGSIAFAALSGGLYHTCGLTSAGAAYCWGLNQYGGLGDGTTIQRLTPVGVRRR